MWLHHRTDTRGGEVQIWIADSDGGDKPWSEVETWMQIMCCERHHSVYACLSLANGEGMLADGTSSLPVSTTVPDSSFGQLPAGSIIPTAPVDLMQSYQYGPLPNRSVTHLFLLAAFHSKFIGDCSICVYPVP